MQKVFRDSLCYQGLRGGAIFVDNKFVVYKNQTLTLPEKYKNIVIPIEEIAKVERGYKMIATINYIIKNSGCIPLEIKGNRNGFMN